MKFSLSKITVIVISSVALTVVAINTFFAGDVSKSNTVFIHRTFKGIVEEVNRGEASYDIYTYEKQDYYKVPADWADCFLYQNFKSNARPGDHILIGIRTGTMFTKDRVVSLKLKHVDYLSPTCINNQIKDQKEDVGFIFGIFIIVGVSYYLYKREHSTKNKTRL